MNEEDLKRQLDEQIKFNKEMEEAILRGQAHVYYGEALGSGILLALMFLTSSAIEHILIAIGFAINVGVLVDLYTHRYTH